MANNSDVSICNSALYLLGSSPIASLDPAADSSDKASLCRQFYDETRDAVLTAYPWNFAVRRAQLSLLDTTPSFEFSYAHRLPNDPYCLRVLNVHDPEIEWQIEGRDLLSDSQTIKIRYIAQITDVSQYSYLYRQAFSALLASKLCYGITGSTSKTAEMYKLYQAFLVEAEDIDTQEGTPPLEENDDLLWVR